MTRERVMEILKCLKKNAKTWEPKKKDDSTTIASNFNPIPSEEVPLAIVRKAQNFKNWEETAHWREKNKKLKSF